MTVEDVIADYYDETKDCAECNAYADALYQEALRISMELNNRYHTPEEIRAIVTKDVPPFTVAGGVPAQIIKKIDKEDG